MVVNGCVRDKAELAAAAVGICALGLVPLPTERRNEGQRDIPLQIQGIWIKPGERLVADEDGIVVLDADGRSPSLAAARRRLSREQREHAVQAAVGDRHHRLLAHRRLGVEGDRRPAAAIIGRSLAPSPTAIACAGVDAERCADLEQHAALLGAVDRCRPRAGRPAGR